MFSFLSLPPETRMLVYDMVLRSCEMSTKRISYISHHPLRYRENLSSAVRYKLPFMVHENHLTFKGIKAIKKEDITNAECNIHLADVDDLLCLASTCRLIRSEVLALAWSNADISITSPALLSDLHYIFLHRLSSNICTFVRTLQIKIENLAWPSEDMSRIVGLIHRRLPQLEELVLNIPIRLRSRRTKRNAQNDALMALRGLPREVTVIFHYWTTQNCFFSRPDGGRESMAEGSKNMDAYFKEIRYAIDMERKRRSDEHTKREQGDQVADVLEATVALRSLSMA